MSARETIRALLAAATSAPAFAGEGDQNGGGGSLEDWHRKAARGAWVRKVMAKLRAAQRKLDSAWDRTLAALPDDLSDEELEALHLPDPPEQAELDALRALIDAVVERDLWPRELYWGCV